MTIRAAASSGSVGPGDALSSWAVRAVESERSEADTAFAALREELRRTGALDRPLRPLLLAYAGHRALAFGGVAACIVAPSLGLKAAAMLVSCFGFVGIGTLGHTASHNAASHRPWINRALYYFSYPFVLQVSACYWRYSHIQVHHPQPNVVDLDDDCDLRPAFAINRLHLDQVGGWRRRWPLLQGLSLPLLLPFNGFNILRQSWRRLFIELLDPRRRGPDQWLDLACLVGHLLCWLALPLLWFSAADVLLFYAVRAACIGVGLFAVLAPGHFPPEAACLGREQREHGDFVLRQVATTVDFRTGPLGGFLCSGLDHQIEHHLFPSVSHVKLEAVRPLVEAFCRRAGLPYQRLGWGEAIWKSWRVFFVPKEVVTDVEALRARR